MDEYTMRQVINNAGDILDDDYLKAKKAAVSNNSFISKFKIDPADTTLIRGFAPSEVRKPTPYEFVRTYLDMEDTHRYYMLEIKDYMDSIFYIVSREIAATMPKVIKEYALQIAITDKGITFVWPLKTYGVEKGKNRWNCSAWNAAKLARSNWTKVTSNKAAKQWDFFKADDNKYPEPHWPLESYEEMLEKAFADKMINRIDDQVLKDFRGEI